jgi:hypothetical protein
MPDQIAGVSEETSTPLNFSELFEASMAEFGSGDEGTDGVDGAEGEEGNPESTEAPETGTTEGDEAATESGTPTQTEIPWNWQEHASKPVKVKVAGQEVEVPLEQALQGFMRQEDYTRKTQDLAEIKRAAEWADNFQRQLREDPQYVLRTLAAAFETEATREIDPYEAQIAKLVESDPELAPMAQLLLEERRQRVELENRLNQTDQQYQQQAQTAQQRESIAQVEREIADVKAKYADFDEGVALQMAASKPGLNLEEAWLLYRAVNPAPVSQETAPTPAPKAQSNTAAKEALAASTTNTRLQGKPDVDPDEYSDFSELFEIMSKTAQR